MSAAYDYRQRWCRQCHSSTRAEGSDRHCCWCGAQLFDFSPLFLAGALEAIAGTADRIVTFGDPQAWRDQRTIKAAIAALERERAEGTEDE